MSTIIVLNGNDSGPGSLRAAINTANLIANTTINFDPSVTAVMLTSGTLTINNEMTISGAGVNPTISVGSGFFAVFTVNATINAVNINLIDVNNTRKSIQVKITYR